MKKRLIITLCLINVLIVILSGCDGNYDINQLYEITDNGNFTYDYVIKDRHDNILISDKDVSRKPKVNVINEDLLSISVQTGTGISTRWTIYCDVNCGNVSDTYYSVLGEYEENVVFVNYDNGRHSVIIQDIFNQGEYLKEVVLEDVSETVDPIVDYVKFDDKIKIMYLKGNNFLETELIIEM
ncbi:MAG: hypothetical protein IKK37_07665 [Clostridia bacterium]|nr:hypothetical protein [Clostridia bacterium]